MTEKTETTTVKKTTTRTVKPKPAPKATVEPVQNESEMTDVVTSLKNELDALKATLEDSKNDEQKVEANNPIGRKRLNQIDVNELIPVRSLTNNKLIYISKTTGARYVWSEYGSIEYLTFGEINTMRSQYPKFIKDCMVLIEDDDVIELFNLGSLYEELYKFEDLDSLLNKSNHELEETIKKMPNGLKKSISSRAKELIEQEVLMDHRKIKTLENALGIDLVILLK